MVRLLRFGALLTAVLGALAPASAQGRLGRSVELVGPLGSGGGIVVAASANGYEAFAWLRGGAGGYVQARVRLPDGRLSAAVRISATHGRAYQPAIGIDGAGEVTVAWLAHVRGLVYALEVSAGAAGGPFRAPVELARLAVSRTCCGTSDGTPGVLGAGDDYGIGPVVAVASDGAAVVSWQGETAMYAAERPAGRCAPHAARACFAATQTLAAGLPPSARVLYGAARPRIAFGPGDVAYLAWAGRAGLEVAVARAHHGFVTSTIAAGTAVFDAPALALTGGELVIAWRWWPAATCALCGSTATIGVAVRDPSGAISSPVELPQPTGSAPPGDAHPPDVFVDPHGQAVIDWQYGDFAIAEAVRAADGTLSAPGVVGDDVVGAEPLIMDGHGNEVLTYCAGPDQEAFIQLRAAGGTFGGATMLPDTAYGAYSFLLLRTPDVVTIGWTTPAGTVLSDIRQ
jgi:hypothetical protein